MYVGVALKSVCSATVIHLSSDLAISIWLLPFHGMDGGSGACATRVVATNASSTALDTPELYVGHADRNGEISRAMRGYHRRASPEAGRQFCGSQHEGRSRRAHIELGSWDVGKLGRHPWLPNGPTS